MTRRTLFTDDFNRPDGPLGANWDYDGTHSWFGLIDILNHAVEAQFASLSAQSARCVQALPGEQWAQFQYVGGLPSETGDYNIGVYTRMDLAGDAYLFEFQTFSGIWTVIDTGGVWSDTGVVTGMLPGDYIRFEAQGGQLRLYINDVLKVTVVDPNIYNSGSSGFFFFGQVFQNVGIVVVDNFSCGDFVASEEPQIFITT